MQMVSEWVFISPLFALSSHLTRYLTTPCIFSIIRKNKTYFQPNPVAKGTLSSVLTVKLVNDMNLNQPKIF